jgi:hypothetical protein
MSKPAPSLIPANATRADAEEMKDLFFKNARTFQDFTALTPESMEVIYLVAYNHYNAGKYEDAEKVFRLLTTLNHFERKYWKGLAAARESLNASLAGSGAKLSVAGLVGDGLHANTRIVVGLGLAHAFGRGVEQRRAGCRQAEARS